MSAWLRAQALAQAARPSALREALTVPFAPFDPPAPGPAQVDVGETADTPVERIDVAESPSQDDVIAHIVALRRELQRVGWLVLITAFGVAVLHALPALRWLIATA